jgi:hypothetical protein
MVLFDFLNKKEFEEIELLKKNNKLNNFPKQKEKLHLFVYSTLGVDVDKVNQIKFDYELAHELLRFYKSLDIPKIEKINIPKEVPNVKFISNLVNSEAINTKIDTLIKPHITD